MMLRIWSILTNVYLRKYIGILEAWDKYNGRMIWWMGSTNCYKNNKYRLIPSKQSVYVYRNKYHTALQMPICWAAIFKNGHYGFMPGIRITAASCFWDITSCTRVWWSSRCSDIHRANLPQTNRNNVDAVTLYALPALLRNILLVILYVVVTLLHYVIWIEHIR